MFLRLAALIGLSIGTIIAPGPVLASGPDCRLALDVPSRVTYGETVSIEITGLSGIGGIDFYTRHGRMVIEDHLNLVPGTTDFIYIYNWTPPSFPPLPPLEPGHYVVEAVHGPDCVARTTFHVDRPS